jgi:hypothetical protein
MTFSNDPKLKKDIQQIFTEREKQDVKNLYEIKEYKEASEIKKMELRLALKMRNILRLD